MTELAEIEQLRIMLRLTWAKHSRPGSMYAPQYERQKILLELCKVTMETARNRYPVAVQGMLYSRLAEVTIDEIAKLRSQRERGQIEL